MSLPKTFSMKAPGGKTIQIPSVGFGTWATDDPSWSKDAVLAALHAGYRHIDTAWFYGVHAEIGAAIRESGIPRSEIFITSKFWPNFAAPENMELCLDMSLRDLGVEYVDLWLMHWPFALKPISRKALENAKGGAKYSNREKGILEEGGMMVKDWEYTAENIAGQVGEKGSSLPTWQAMEELVKKGKARAIGLSNFSIAELEAVLPHAKEIPISCNQIEVHPWLPQNKLIEFGKKNGILTVCYCPLGGAKRGPELLKDEKIQDLAEKSGLDVGQLLQSWAVQRGTVPLGKSATPSRIKSNLQVKKLSEEVMKALGSLEIPDGKGRTVDFTEAWGLPLFTN